MAILEKCKWIASCFQESTVKIKDKLSAIFSHKKIDQESLEKLEELLISADVGLNTAKQLTGKISSLKLGHEVTIDQVKQILADEMIKIIKPVVKPIEFSANPHVILFCGVNGNGKTTTVGKLAYRYNLAKKSVVMAACDTFRAAAQEQLEIWAKYSECDIITGEENSDPASVAYKAMAHAKEKNADVVLIDTAGRLHTYKNFMEELNKMVRIIKKHDVEAPHNTILVIDATTGQNAVNQVRVFKEMININGIILTKLDGTSKGGIIVSLAKQYPDIALHYIGTGEGVEDIESFSAEELVEAILGIDN